MDMFRSFFRLEAAPQQLVARTYPLTELDEVCAALDLAEAGNTSVEVMPSNLATASCLSAEVLTLGITATPQGAIYKFSVAGSRDYVQSKPIPKDQLSLARRSEFPIFLGFSTDASASARSQTQQASAHQAA